MEELEKTIKNGVVKGLAVYFTIFGVSVVVLLLIMDYVRPYDNTDNGKERSGLTIRTDNLTGCQYLSTPSGGLTPRMDQSGTYQICTTPVRKVN